MYSNLCFSLSLNPMLFYFHPHIVRKKSLVTNQCLSDPQNGSRWQVFQDVLSPDQENLDLANVNLMLELLVQKKKQLEAVSKCPRVVARVFPFSLCHFVLRYPEGRTNIPR